MRLFTLTLTAIGAVSAVACTESATKSRAELIQHDSAGISIAESWGPRNAAAGDSAFMQVEAQPVLTIGTEEGDETYQFHRIGDATRLADGRIAVSNTGSNEIRFFDAAGST